MKMDAKDIVAMLLGGDNRNCVAVMIDDDWVGYLEEQEDGYDDYDEPVFTASNSDDEPFMSITMNDLKNATVCDTYIYVKHGDESYTIHPLTKMKIN